MMLINSSAIAAERYDIVYTWVPTISDALESSDAINKILGEDFRKSLRVVKRADGRFGVVALLGKESKSAQKHLAKQKPLLADLGLENVRIIGRTDYVTLYNVSYGLGPNLDVHKRNFDIVTRMLGEGVKKHLVIEQTAYDNYALVYKRFGDMDSTRKLAIRHTKLLKKTGIEAAPIAEGNNEQIFGESSHLDEKITVELSKRKWVAPKKTTTEKSIQKKVNAHVQTLRASGKVSKYEQTSWSVYDFSSGEKFVSINEETSRQCASMFKPFVALAFFHEVKRKRFRYGKKSKSKMRAMIQRSSNSATNWLMKQVGGPKKLNKLLTKHYGGIFRQTHIVEYIPKGGRTYKNKSTARDYSRFLYALWKGSLPYAREIRRLMALPGSDRIYTNVAAIPEGTLVYNKTGSTAHLIGDMGILVARGKDGKIYPYTFIGIIQRSKRPKDYSAFARKKADVIRSVSGLVYKELKKKHKLV